MWISWHMTFFFLLKREGVISIKQFEMFLKRKSSLRVDWKPKQIKQSSPPPLQACTDSPSITASPGYIYLMRISGADTWASSARWGACSCLTRILERRLSRGHRGQNNSRPPCTRRLMEFPDQHLFWYADISTDIHIWKNVDVSKKTLLPNVMYTSKYMYSTATTNNDDYYYHCHPWDIEIMLETWIFNWLKYGYF